MTTASNSASIITVNSEVMTTDRADKEMNAVIAEKPEAAGENISPTAAAADLPETADCEEPGIWFAFR